MDMQSVGRKTAAAGIIIIILILQYSASSSSRLSSPTKTVRWRRWPAAERWRPPVTARRRPPASPCSARWRHRPGLPPVDRRRRRRLHRPCHRTVSARRRVYGMRLGERERDRSSMCLSLCWVYCWLILRSGWFLTDAALCLPHSNSTGRLPQRAWQLNRACPPATDLLY